MKRNRMGFTMVELLVSLMTASIVVLAGMSLVMVSMRVQGSAVSQSSRQNSARVVFALIENIAEEAKVNAPEDENYISFTVGESGTEKTVVYYDSGTNSIYVGGDKENNGTVLMNNVSMEREERDNLLTLTVTDELSNEKYTDTIYLRSAQTEPEPLLAAVSEPVVTDASEEESAETAISLPTGGEYSSAEYAGRLSLLYRLSAQEGSPGVIRNAGDGEYRFFSEWYVGGYKEGSGWGFDTPWCACFVSWGLDKCRSFLEVTPRFSSVDRGLERFMDGTEGTFIPAADYDSVVPGDLIFFDWEGVNSCVKDADHVGVVTKISDGRVHTVEGNSEGVVAFRSYELDSSSIFGYVSLKWK